MADQASQAAADREVLFVNVPFYFSSCSRYPEGCANPYPFAPTGAVIIPPYADPRDFVRVNGGPDRPVRAVTFAGYNPGWNTHGESIDLQVLRESVQSAEVRVFDLVTWSWFDLTSAWQVDATSTSSPRATFGDLVALQDLQVEKQGDSLAVTLTWQALQAPSRPLTVFVHLYDASGAVAAQHDGPPAQGFVPTPFWRSGDRVIDTHLVVPAVPLAPGSYQLAVGIYDPNTGERLPALAADGSLLANDAYPAGEVSWP
jgi:hypothetical protein